MVVINILPTPFAFIGIVIRFFLFPIAFFSFYCSASFFSNHLEIFFLGSLISLSPSLVLVPPSINTIYFYKHRLQWKRWKWHFWIRIEKENVNSVPSAIIATATTIAHIKRARERVQMWMKSENHNNNSRFFSLLFRSLAFVSQRFYDFSEHFSFVPSAPSSRLLNFNKFLVVLTPFFDICYSEFHSVVAAACLIHALQWKGDANIPLNPRGFASFDLWHLLLEKWKSLVLWFSNLYAMEFHLKCLPE